MIRFTRRPNVAAMRRRLGNDPARVVNAIRHECTDYDAKSATVFASEEAEKVLAALFAAIANLDPWLRREAGRQWKAHCQRLAA